MKPFIPFIVLIGIVLYFLILLMFPTVAGTILFLGVVWLTIRLKLYNHEMENRNRRTERRIGNQVSRNFDRDIQSISEIQRALASRRPIGQR